MVFQVYQGAVQEPRNFFRIVHRHQDLAVAGVEGFRGIDKNEPYLPAPYERCRMINAILGEQILFSPFHLAGSFVNVRSLRQPEVNVVLVAGGLGEKH